MSRSLPIRLSPEQQAVVDYPLLPLRVSAGAGTGKTTTVSYRMARLVTEEGVPPERLLGLTFTNKAAGELSHKIHEVLSGRADPLREAQVNTYHGFCAQIVTEFGAVLGMERSLSIVGPAQTRQLIKRVIRENDLSGLDNTDMFYLPGAIIRFSSSLADHLVDPDRLDETMLAPGIPLLDGAQFRRKGDLYDYERLVSSVEKRRGMVEAARGYQDYKRSLGVVDYGDLIVLAHRILDTEPQIARRVRDRYQAAVADEYQDTNAAQRAILQLLFGDGFPLTVVGDSDQTLYEWRGASLGNFRRFPTHFPTVDATPSRTLHLTLNRRSGAAIIHFANRVKEKIGSDTPGLKPLADAPRSRVTAEWHPTFIDEAVWIAEQMIERHREGRSWREMAVLFRKTKDIKGVYRRLVSHNIPAEVANLGGLLVVPEVVEIHSWLKVIGRFDDRVAAARLLSGSRFRLGLGDIRILAATARRVPEGAPRSLLDGLENDRFWDDLSDSQAEAFGRFHAEYRELLGICQSRSAGEACRLILERTGVWADVESMSDNTRLSARLNLYRFLELAEGWSPLEGQSTIGGFLDYLDALLEEPSEEVDAARLSDEDAVALLTVHKAKGLEWPVVFVPAVYGSNFPSQAVGGYDNPYRKTETLPWKWRLDPPPHEPITAGMDASGLTGLLESTTEEVKAQHQSQEWRIAYVAATRAKEELAVSGAHWYGYPEPTMRPRLPHQSEFFKLAWQAATGPAADRDLTEELEQAFPPPPRPESFANPAQAAHTPDDLFKEEGWPEGIRRALEDPDWIAGIARQEGVEEEYQTALEEFSGLLFRLPDPTPDTGLQEVSTSATGIVTYAQCPKKYFWSSVDPLPRRYSYATRRGTRIHRQIELHHQGKVPLLEPEDEFRDLTGDDRPIDSPAHPFDVFLNSRFANMKTQWLERGFTLRLGEGFLVRGRIDAVYRTESGAWEIVDFKSGRPPSDDPHEARLAQMQVYALAVRDIPELGPAPDDLSVTIAYLGGGGLAESPSAEDVGADWLAAARRRLEAIAGSIRDQQWDPTPSTECRACDFYRVCPEGKAFISSIGRTS
ncbi:MAG: ATP-dependent DNA helicase [bacterium]|nr:ATP-dependent DNA helicase [bacterium]